MLLTQIAHLALFKTALIIFGSFRAMVIWKILSFALIKCRTHFTRVKYLSSYLSVIRYSNSLIRWRSWTSYLFKNTSKTIFHLMSYPSGHKTSLGRPSEVHFGRRDVQSGRLEDVLRTWKMKRFWSVQYWSVPDVQGTSKGPEKDVFRTRFCLRDVQWTYFRRDTDVRIFYFGR